MAEPQQLIATRKRSIHRYFASCALPSTEAQSRPRQPRKSNHFRAIEAIYAQDQQRFAALCNDKPVRLPKLQVKEKSPKFRSMALFEPRRRRKGTAGSLSPKKPMSSKQSSGCLLDGYPHSLTLSWGASKELLSKSSRRMTSIHSLQPVLSEKVGSVIEKCKKVQRSSSQLALVRKEQKLLLSLESFMDTTERTIEKIDTSPGELLEPMYAMRREVDTAILEDAQELIKEDKGNLNETTNKINRMIEREARRRKHIDKDG